MRQTTKPGRNCAQKRWIWTGALFAVFLILPLWALWEVGGLWSWWLPGGYGAVLNGAAYFVLRSDKRRASAAQWRIPEARMHTLELLGGWPGSFLAQQVFRHKTRKGSYQAVFWLIVVLHQILALDYVRGWPWMRATAAALQM